MLFPIIPFLFPLFRRSKLPHERPHRFPILDPPFDYDQRKQVAVEETMKFLFEKCFPVQNQIDEDDEENEDSADEQDPKEIDDDDFEPLFSEILAVRKPRHERLAAANAERQRKLTKLKTFVEALPNCVPLDMGYLTIIDFVDADKFCWCPCQDNRFWRWRREFDVDTDLPFTCTSLQKFTPHALRKHLESKTDGPLNDYSTVSHKLVHEYLTHCYKNYTFVESRGIWLNHKGHYDPGSENFRIAEAAQNEIIHR